jgi:hypothetical protein
MKKYLTLIAVSVLVFVNAVTAHADVPFNNLEGVGGVAFNPLAYVAQSADDNVANRTKKATNPWDELTKYVAKPRIGTWYVNLPDRGINWENIGVATSFFDRVEVSYGFQSIGIKDGKTHSKNNVGAKLLVLPENSFGSEWVPAISVGGIYKNTDTVIAGARNNGWDGYLVASKLITQLPRPVLISGGTLLTNSYATGALGYDKKSKFTLFGNVDLILTDWLALGFEYKQGPEFKNKFNNADYWDLHAAWLVNKNLTIIAAYVYTGDIKSKKTFGLGDGFTVSAQYSF